MILAAVTEEQGVPEVMAAAVDRRLRIGVGLTVIVAIGLSLGTQLGFWHALGLALFYSLLPALSLAQLPLLRLHEIERVPVYLGSAVTILVMGAVAVALGLTIARPGALGFNWIPLGECALWAAGATGFGLIIVGLTGRKARSASDIVLQLIPRTPQERRLFVALSVTAGLGEEIAYRGYAFVAIQPLISSEWGAAALASVAFGVLHAYQGWLGIVRTALIGFALAIPVLFTGSLLPGIVAHALIDVVAGLVIGPRILAAAEGNLSLGQ